MVPFGQHAPFLLVAVPDDNSYVCAGAPRESGARLTGFSMVTVSTPPVMFSFLKPQPPEPQPTPIEDTPLAPALPATRPPMTRAAVWLPLKQGLTRRRQFGGRLAGLFGPDASSTKGLQESRLFCELRCRLTATDFLTPVSAAGAARLYAAAQLRDASPSSCWRLFRPIASRDVTTQTFRDMLVGVHGPASYSIGSSHTILTPRQKSVSCRGRHVSRRAREPLIEGARAHVKWSRLRRAMPPRDLRAVKPARARGIDIVLADTAGRLPTQAHLMTDQEKVKRVIDKALPGALRLLLFRAIPARTDSPSAGFDNALESPALSCRKLAVPREAGSSLRSRTRARKRIRPAHSARSWWGEALDDSASVDAELRAALWSREAPDGSFLACLHERPGGRLLSRRDTQH